MYSIIEEELLLSDVDGHVLVADNEELSLSDADGHTLVADTMPLSLSDADVHALVADNEGSLRPCLIEEKEQQHDGKL